MSAPFDPYREWLGIPPAQQLPHHYQLLGLSLYEGEPEAIRQAAKQRIARVRDRAGDEQQDLVRQIVNELAVARDCLLNTTLKTQYDARLRASGVRATPAPPPAPPFEAPPAPASAAPTNGPPPVSEFPRAIPVSPAPAEDATAVSPAPHPTDPAADVPDAPDTKTEAKESPKGEEREEEAPAGLPKIDVSGPTGSRRPGSSTGGRPSLRGPLPDKLPDALPDKLPSTLPGTSATKARGGPGARRAARGARAANGRTGSHSARASSRQQSQAPWLVAGGGVGVILLFLLIAAINSGEGPEPAKPRAQQPAQVKERPRSKPSSGRPRRSSSGGSYRGGTPPPTGPRTFEDLLNHTDDPPENNTVTGQLTAARRAMSERKLDKAHARLHAAMDLARSPYEVAEVERVEKLLGSLETFWRTVREEAAILRPAQEIKMGDEYIILSEARGGVLTFRYAGRFVQYQALELPPKLAVALAERRLKPDRSETHLHVGSFLAVDAQGDRQEARRRWEQAGEPGAELLPELELAPPVKNGPAEPPDPTS